MNIDLHDDQTRALLNVLIEVIEADRYPLSPRIQLLRRVLAKFGEQEGCRPDLERKLLRQAPPPPAASAPKIYEPQSKGRYRRW